MTPDEIREDIELKIVELIREKLDNNEITEARAQQLSEIALKVLVPGMTMEELYRAIPKLDDSSTELCPIVLPYMRDYEEQITKMAQKTVQELIHQGQYDAAVKLSKQAIEKNISIVWQGSGKATDTALSQSNGQGSGKPARSEQSTASPVHNGNAQTL